MLKVLFLPTLIPFTAAAAECPVKDNDMDKIVKAITATKGCGEAAETAQACAFGSTADIHIAGAASAVCEKVFVKNKSDKDLYDKLAKRCGDKYAKADGTMYRSAAAFCKLRVAQLLADLNKSPE